MIDIPESLKLALEAVVDIAFHGTGELVRASDIQGRLGLAPRRLEPLLQQMTRAGVLLGVRGPKGGYKLGRERRLVTLADIVRALDGGELPAAEEDRSDLSRLVLEPMWQSFDEPLLTLFASVSVEELCRRAHAAKLEPERVLYDFSI